MASFDRFPASIQKSLEDHRLFKVISGLSNFDTSSVELVARSARLGGADLLDIACDPDLVRLAIETSALPVCVSSVEPELFPAAVEAGASLVEIGNFDTFYPKGRIFEAQEVLALTQQTRALLPRVLLSVTVPHILPLHEQEQLALDLVHAGADLIQTEGSCNAKTFSPGTLGLIEKAAPTLAAAHSISHAFQTAGCKVPIICASGLSAITVPMAIAAGAAGVGIGSAVNLLSDQVAMIAAVKRVKQSLAVERSLIRKI